MASRYTTSRPTFKYAQSAVTGILLVNYSHCVHTISQTTVVYARSKLRAEDRMQTSPMYLLQVRRIAKSERKLSHNRKEMT